MIRFSRWLTEQYELTERKKAHYSKATHDAENYPQVGQEYENLRNTSKPSLKKIAQKRGVNPNEPMGKLTTDILSKEFGPDKVAGFYDKKKDDNVAKAQARKKAKEAAKPSYMKDVKESLNRFVALREKVNSKWIT